MTEEQFLALPLVPVAGVVRPDGLSVSFFMHEGFSEPKGDLVARFAARIVREALADDRIGWLKKVDGNRENPFNNWPVYGVVNHIQAVR